jgi:hypothetical protein
MRGWRGVRRSAGVKNKIEMTGSSSSHVRFECIGIL